MKRRAKTVPMRYRVLALLCLFTSVTSSGADQCDSFLGGSLCITTKEKFNFVTAKQDDIGQFCGVNQFIQDGLGVHEHRTNYGFDLSDSHGIWLTCAERALLTQLQANWKEAEACEPKEFLTQVGQIFQVKIFVPIDSNDFAEWNSTIAQARKLSESGSWKVEAIWGSNVYLQEKNSTSRFELNLLSAARPMIIGQEFALRDFLDRRPGHLLGINAEDVIVGTIEGEGQIRGARLLRLVLSTTNQVRWYIFEKLAQDH